MFGKSDFRRFRVSGKLGAYELENPVLPLQRALEVYSAGHVLSGEKRSRREWLRRASRLAVGIPLSAWSASEAFAGAAAWPDPQQNPPPLSGMSSLFSSDPTKYRFTLEEDRFLEQLERACFQYFWDEANPYTGLVKDRSQANGSDSRNVASIAATGFGLTGLCIADHRG